MRFGLIAMFGTLLLLGGITYVSATPHTGVQIVTITDQEMRPSAFHVKANSTVKITVKNSGSKKHNFVLPACYLFTHNLNPGETTDLEFTAAQTGALPYYSDAPGQEEPGLHGRMFVK